MGRALRGASIGLPVTQHVCSLPIRDTSGLPKLPPNAKWTKKTIRKLRKGFLLNPGNIRVKKLFRNKSSMMAERKKHASGPNCYVFHPLSVYSTIIETMFCITWLYSLIVDPIMIYADEFHYIFIFMQSTIVFSLRFFIVAMFFNVGYVDSRTNVCIVDRKKIMNRYLKTFFIFDIISILALNMAQMFTNLGVMYCTIDYKATSDCYGYVYLLRLMCSCVRINKLFKSIDDVFTIMNMGYRMRFSIIYTLKTFIYLHLFAFTIYFIPYMQFRGKWPPESWLAQAELSHGSGFKMQYAECLIVATCYFFGIDYRFHIEEFEEQLCISVITYLGRLYTLYLTADILGVFGIVGISESMYEKQLVSLEQYMSEKDLPESLRQRMLLYYHFKFQRRYFRENEILSTLSDHLRTELFLYRARKLVQKVEFFKRLPATTLGDVIACMKSETYSPKDVIVKIGSQIEDIFFISTGTVALLSMGGIEICHLDDGEEFGSTCIVMKEQLYAVVAVETTEVFYIHKNQFLDLLSPHNEVLSMFHQSVKNKLLKYHQLEENIVQGKVDLMSELKKGHILEKRNVKLVAR